MMKQYKTSIVEMNRRKVAFTTFIISIFITICIFSIDGIRSFPQISLPILSIFVVIIILLILGLNKTLDKQSYLQIYLSDTELTWKYKNAVDKYLLSDIKSIRVKRTTKGNLREIRIGMPGMKFRYINGLKEFEGFVEDLTSKIENAKIINFKEPIDFDHRLYYVILGVLFGIGTTSLVKMLFTFDITNLKHFQNLISLEFFKKIIRHGDELIISMSLIFNIVLN